MLTMTTTKPDSIQEIPGAEKVSDLFSLGNQSTKENLKK